LAIFSLLAIEARSGLGLGPRERARRQRRFQYRVFAVSCTPVLAYVLISSSVGAVEALQMRIDTVAVWYAAYMIVLFVLFASSMPWLLRNSWETEPMPGGVERSLLESVAALAGFDGRRLFVWRTDRSVANAAIIGLFPRHRVVLFSDLLLAQLDLRELASVFAHEIGHAKRGHVVVFGAWALAALFAADLLATRIAPEDEFWQASILMASTALWAVLFGWMSRRFELEADLYSLRLLGDVSPLIRALEKVSGPHGRARTSWRHFSTQRRIEFLEGVVREPALGSSLERRLRWVARLGIVLFLVVMAAEGYALARQWPTDLLVLDLRRGDYAAAVQRVENRSVEDEDLVALVRKSASLRSGEVAEIETRARAALASRDFAALGQWLDLGALRGDAGMRRVAELISDLKSAPPASESEVEAWREEVPPEWRDALEPLVQAARR
jgi:Zn-dependent protease with chaperone function